MAVDGVALRAAPDGGPLRDPLLDDAREVQALPHRDQSGPGRQQIAEDRERGRRPGRRDRRAVGGEVLQGGRRDADVVAGGDQGGPQDEQRVAGRLDARAENRLPVGEEESVPERSHPRAPRADAQGPGPLGLSRSPQGPVEGVRDEPGRGGHIGQELVGVVVAEQGGGSVVVLARQPVAAAAGDDVHRVTDVEELLVCGVDGSVGPVGEPGGGEGTQHGHVAQPAAGLLEVRFEQVGEVALARVPLRDLLLQLRQAGSGVAAPVVGDGGLRRVDDVLLARHEGDVEEADSGRQVGSGHRAALVDGPDAVVQLHALVPDRVPEPVGQGGEFGGAEGPGLVQQDEIEVAERTPVTAGQAAHGGQSHSGKPASRGGLVPELGEPLRTELGEGGPSRGTGTGSREAPGAGQVEAPRGHVGRAGHRIGPFHSCTRRVGWDALRTGRGGGRPSTGP